MKRTEEVFDFKLACLHFDLARLNFRNVEQIIHHFLQALSGRANKEDLFFLFRGQIAVQSLKQHLRER
ncbi:MAG TPA: hypothetical protein VJT08_12145 [Terriglobales bacterium]|nr:hypothetical protein [Terriglobales bacterium]